jgi:hypothetical protein
VVLEQIDPPHIATERVERLVRLTSESFQIEAPVSAAEVRSPERSEWPL